jgi:prepilin peptidase CpaA
LQITGLSLLLFILSLICIGLILAASLHDIAVRTIPNGLVLALAIAGIGMGATDGYLFGSLLAASGVFAVSALCWRRGWLGGGDVKLLGAAALGMPASSALTFVAAVAIAGGVLAAVYLVGRRFMPLSRSPRPKSMFGRAMRVERWRISRGGPLPYACAIAAGFLFVHLSGRMS